MTQCSYQRFRVTYCSRLQTISTLNVDAVCCFEAFVITHNVNPHSPENIGPHIGQFLIL
jgi:hypothetical protein